MSESRDCRKCVRFHVVEVNRRLESMCGRRPHGAVNKRWHCAVIEPDSQCPKMGERDDG